MDSQSDTPTPEYKSFLRRHRTYWAEALPMLALAFVVGSATLGMAVLTMAGAQALEKVHTDCKK